MHSYNVIILLQVLYIKLYMTSELLEAWMTERISWPQGTYIYFVHMNFVKRTVCQWSPTVLFIINNN